MVNMERLRGRSVALETPPEFSPTLYDDLRDRLHARGREQAVALTYQLLCSGRPLSEIIAETAPAACVRHGRLDVYPDPGRPTGWPTAPHLSPPAEAFAPELGVEDRAQMLPAGLEPETTGRARPGANGPELAGEGPQLARRAHEVGDISDQRRRGIDEPSSPARPLATLASATAVVPTAALPDSDVSIAAAGERSHAWRRGWRIGLLAAYSALLVAATAFGFPLLHRIAPTAPAAGPAAGASAQVPSPIKLAIDPAGVRRTEPALADPALAVSVLLSSRDAPDTTPSPLELEKSTLDIGAPPAATPRDAAAAGAAVFGRNGPATASAADRSVAKQGSQAPDPSEITVEALVARGDILLGTGDVVTARLFYRHASDRDDSAAALRLGETFDTAFLREAGLGGIAGDPATARYWYRRAHDLGNRDALILLKGLEPAGQ